jgi:hypothetical protein
LLKVALSTITLTLQKTISDLLLRFARLVDVLSLNTLCVRLWQEQNTPLPPTFSGVRVAKSLVSCALF